MSGPVAVAHGQGVDVDAVARSVERCPSVARLAAWNGVEVATYLPGRKVPGVRVVGGELEVHVVARYGSPLPGVAAEIRRALETTAGGLPVAVFIDELEVPG